MWSSLERVSLFPADPGTPVLLGIALLVALALDSGRLYGRNFFRISIFLPYAVPAVVATLMSSSCVRHPVADLVGDINSAFDVAPYQATATAGAWSWRRSATSSPGSSWATTC